MLVGVKGDAPTPALDVLKSSGNPAARTPSPATQSQPEVLLLRPSLLEADWRSTSHVCLHLAQCLRIIPHFWKWENYPTMRRIFSHFLKGSTNGAFKIASLFPWCGFSKVEMGPEQDTQERKKILIPEGKLWRCCLTKNVTWFGATTRYWERGKN